MKGVAYWIDLKLENRFGKMFIQDLCDCIEYGTRIGSIFNVISKIVA
jgi:hypothetical protein